MPWFTLSLSIHSAPTLSTQTYWEDYHPYGLWKPRVVFTIHNLNYGKKKLSEAAYFCQKFTTVSPTYAFETGGCGRCGKGVWQGGVFETQVCVGARCGRGYVVDWWVWERAALLNCLHVYVSGCCLLQMSNSRAIA